MYDDLKLFKQHASQKLHKTFINFEKSQKFSKTPKYFKNPKPRSKCIKCMKNER